MSFSTNLNSDSQMGAFGAVEFGEAEHPDLVKARKAIAEMKQDEIKEGKEDGRAQSKPTVESQGIGAKKSRQTHLPSSKDISNNLERSVREESAKKIEVEAGKPKLFTTWEGDQLSVYLCEAGALVLLLSFQLRQSLSEAQLIEAENQINSAQKSAELRREQGEADKRRLYNDAAQGIVSGAVGLASFGHGVYDTVKSRPQEQRFMGQDKMNIELNQGLERQTDPTMRLSGRRTTGGVIDPGPSSPPVERTFSEADPTGATPKVTYGDRAENLGREGMEKYQEKLKELSLDTESRDKYITDNIGGIDQKGYAEVAVEYEMKCQREASEAAWNHIDSELKKHTDVNGKGFNESLRDDPDVAQRFMKGAGVDDKPDAVIGMFSSQDNPGQYPVPDGMKKINYKSEIMKSFGASRALSTNPAHPGKTSSDVFRDKVASERHQSEMMMRKEEGRYNDRRNHRMLIGETLNGFTRAGTGMASADEMVTAANAEGHAKEMDTVAQLMGAAKGSQDSTIMSALEKVVSFFREMSDAKAQMASALNASLSA